MKADPKDSENEGAAPTPPAPPAEGPRSFVNVLAKISDGELESEASYQLHELGKRLQELSLMTHGKAKGKVKLILNLTADPSGTVALSYQIDVTAPKMPTTPAIFWLTKGGNLTPQNPKQLEIGGLRDVTAKRELRDAPAPAPTREA